MSGLRRRDFIKIAGSAMATGAFIDFLGNPLVSNVNKKKRPNVILILVDDLGYGDLSCHGNPVVKTPNIDHLYHQSARLTNFHVDPTCSPTRASLLTGRYSSRAGVWHTIMGRSILPKDEVTMAEIFSRNGYKTGIFGKWHLGDNAPFRACDRGFAESLVLGGGAIGNTPDYWDNDYFDDFYSHNGTWEKQSGYCTDVFFKAAMNFIEGVAGQPFFCYLPTNVVHWPHNVAEDYTKPYRGLVPDTRATFYGMLSNLDENIGKLLQFLKAKGLDKDTILIFMSDNGTSFGAEFDRQGFVTKGYNAGMRSHKGSVYEGGHRVPCFIRWPGGGIPSGRDIQGLAAHIDILPTLIDLCGLDVEKDLIFDGLPLSPFLKDNNYKWPERTLIIHNQRVDIPIKGKDYVVMTSIWRLVNGKELYNIREDPGQHRDLSKQYPEVVKKLNEDYEQWWNDISRRFNEYIWIPVG
ncbi:MAG TPA: N-acetylgalactosamine-4-sulfatase, partial [Candidatus Aminicenantes bacterium]|nr:N-acetylgalactosamine-4-sulfatase [Candidatus Aminicenantes bacterium]